MRFSVPYPNARHMAASVSRPWHCDGALNVHASWPACNLMCAAPSTDTGMASAAVKARLERIGQGVLSAAAGMAALRAVLCYVAAGPARAPAVTTVNPFR